MYEINLQLFNSKFRISIFDNLPKKLTFFVKLTVWRKLRKTKISCNAQLSQKIFPVLRKTHCVSCAKIAPKVHKILR